jgi:PAS domain S-box-containing protein
MKNNKSTNETDKLRQRAERFLNDNKSKSNLQLTEAEMLKLIYELEVHHEELRLQNEELRLAQTTATQYAEKYLELYDFAPIGYFTLSKEGAILEINLCASQMLNKERSHLKNSQLGFFISDDTKPVFNLFLWKVFTDNRKQTCEVTLSIEGKPIIEVSLTGIISSNEEQCLVTIQDITDQKRAENELKKWATLFQPKAN